MRTAEGNLYLHVAIDWYSNLPFVQLVVETVTTSASVFLVALIEAVACKTHKVLANCGARFTSHPLR